MAGQTVTFYFEGRAVRGIEGEPVAKALFAAGVRTLSYSVKYKRPRGVHCARGRCVACHMSIDGVPGVPTCITPLEAGMRIERENYLPFYGALATAAARLIPFPAGFYYRMFTRPAFVQRIFLGTLRRMAGVGRLAPQEARTPSSTPRRISPAPVKDSYDLVVVGSGVSGMSAAISAAHHGLHVLLVDEYGFPGGHSLGYQPEAALKEARDHLIERIGSHVAIQYLPHVTAQGFYPPDTLLLGPGGSAGFEIYTRRANEPSGPKDSSGATASGLREGMRRVRARSFIFAAGANDIVPLFPNNDTPGIFGERAIRLLLERDALRPGRRAVVYGTGSALRVTGELLHHHDIELVAFVDPTAVTKAPEHNRRVLDKVRTITEAKIRAAKGNEWLRGVEVSRGRGGERVSLSCDLLCIALPGQAAYELPYQAGIGYSLSYSPIQELRVMLPAVARVARGDDSASFFIVGEAAGESDWRKKIEDGTQAGADAARTAG